jgi:hypothetical protein
MLDGNEVCPNKRNVIDLAEHPNNASMVNPWDQDSEKVC